MSTHHAGELATFDSFGGMIACKVIEVLHTKPGPFGFIERRLKIQITDKSHPAYRHGEIVEASADKVYPRSCWKRSRRGPSWINVDSYNWE